MLTAPVRAPSSTSSSCACNARQPFGREATQKAAGGGSQIAGQHVGHGLAASYHLCLDHVVDPGDLKLDSPDESCPACRLEMPDEKRCGQRRRAGDIDEA